MAFPEKVTYPNKYNLRPIVEPDGQFSAENANHIKEKINKNALFHGVHDNLAALQAAWQNPTPGHFAYLLDGTHYRCVNVGWTTNEAGGSGNYFFGYHQDLPALRLAHPTAISGARAILKVIGANDKEVLWDEDAQDWFAFEIIPVGVSTDQYQSLILGSDNLPFLDLRSIGLGGTTSAVNKINSKTPGYQGGLNYKPYGDWNFGSTNFVKTVDPSLQLSAADATYTRLDLIVYNSAGNIIIKQGTPAENPVEPTTDPNTELVAFLIIIPAGATEPEGVSLQKIYDQNLGTAGGEWDFVINSGFWALEDTSDPHTGTKAIKGTNLTQYDRLSAQPLAAIPIAEFTEVVLQIRNITSQPISPFYLQVFGDTGANRGPLTRTLTIGNLAEFGYNPELVDVWQFIAVPVPALSIINIQRLSISVNYNFTTATQVTALFDQIQYNNGSAPSGENFATVGYVEAKAIETLASAKTHTNTSISNAEKWKGSFPNLAALQTAYPAGQVGWTADVDAGIGDPVKRYFWDVSDEAWTIQVGESTAETAASIRTKYLSNTGTEELTTTLKGYYEAAYNWVNTNGANILAHLTKWATPTTAGKMPRTLEGGGIEWINEPTGDGTGGIGTIDFGLTGSIDGTNKIFQTSTPFTTGKVLIFLNGIAQTLGDDYTESTTQIIEFIQAPLVGDKLIALY